MQHYTTLSREEIETGLRRAAVDAQTAFGFLSAEQLNWRAGEKRWSIAQCLQHLVTANELMMEAADRALAGRSPQTIWQRLPVLPRLYGRMLITSQAPTSERRYVAPPQSQPTRSDIAADIVSRFVTQHESAVRTLHALDEQRAARTIMVSPFIRFITYSVLDGWRLILAHDDRHLQQARRVLEQGGIRA